MAIPRTGARRTTRPRPPIDRLSPMDRPQATTAGVQTWRDMLSLHWPIPVDDVRRLVPPSLSIDRFDGKAYISIVAFRSVDSRPAFAPGRFGMSWNEVNVRTYVHRDEKEPGVYMLSCDTDSLMVSLGMRVGGGLACRTSKIEHRHEDGRLDWSCERSDGPVYRATCQLGGRAGAAEPGTLEHFLCERYFLHQERPRSLWTMQIHHAPIDLERARVLEIEDGLIGALGLPEREGEPIVHYAREVKTELFLPSIRM
ncbi:MAG: YqjF family protein [Planctomycetota bacterium]